MRIHNLVTALLSAGVLAVQLDLSSDQSIFAALKLIANGTMDYYWGYDYGGIIGMMTPPYYWWEAGAAWNSMMDYWYYTGDDTYNDILMQSLLYQVGSGDDYMPSNQTTTEGNDDQGFWGITVMNAAERNFTNPPADKPQWLELAQAVFNTMASRWDPGSCGGGLRWQIYPWNNGYDYKNTVANGCLFQMSARLARYTNNQSYADWAEKVYNWVADVQFIEPDFTVIDGGLISANCTSSTPIQWSYNYGLFIAGTAYMYNHTNDQVWLTRLQGLWSKAQVMFNSDGVMYEAACQPSDHCDNDQRCFKGIFSRFLGLAAQLVPSMADEIIAKLSTSAAAAALSCSGGTDGHTCGLNWFEGKWDGVFGLGEQMSALEVIQNTMAVQRAAANGNTGVPLTNSTGGTSKGNPSAGGKSSSNPLQTNTLKITTSDKAGAAILTIVVIVWVLAAGWWMLK